MAKGRIRADLLVYEQGLASGREKAKRLIMVGFVVHGSERIDKPSQLLNQEDQPRLKGQMKYVNRGSYKLEEILEKEKIDLKERICIDIEAFTGGFTDRMLQHGARKVYCIDVGYDQLDYSLRQNPQVVNMEEVNIRHLDPETFAERADSISIDISFTSLELVPDVARNLLRDQGQICALVKPQFETGKDKVGKGGIVRDPKVHLGVLNKMAGLFKDLDLDVEKLTPSPIHGVRGNIEFSALLKKGCQEKEPGLAQIARDAHVSGGQDAG